MLNMRSMHKFRLVRSGNLRSRNKLNVWQRHLDLAKWHGWNTEPVTRRLRIATLEK